MPVRKNYKSKYTRYDPKYDKFCKNDYIADELKVQLNAEDLKKKEDPIEKDAVVEGGDDEKEENEEDGSKKEEEEDGDGDGEKEGEDGDENEDDLKRQTDSNFYPSLQS